MVGRIAVADADQPSLAQHAEVHRVVRHRNQAALRIAHFHGKHGHVLAIGADLRAVGGHGQRGSRARGLALGRQRQLVALVTSRLNRARCVLHVPGQVLVLLHLFHAQALAVEKQFHFIQVRVDPDGDLLAFHAWPVPVRKQVQHRLRGPPGLVVVKRVLRETAGVDDSVLRTDVGPRVGRRFAAIVEACPHKASRQPRPCVAESPPSLG